MAASQCRRAARGPRWLVILAGCCVQPCFVNSPCDPRRPARASKAPAVRALGTAEALAAAAPLAPAILGVFGGAMAASAAQLARAAGPAEAAGAAAESGGFFGEQRWSGRTLGVVGAWLLLLCYALFLAPGKDPEATLADQALLTQILSTPFDGSVSPLFVCIFNMLGIWPAIYAATLLPGAARQSPVPAYPFVFASFFLGAFALSPYLALREYRGKQGESGDLDWFTSNLLESPVTGLLLLAGAVYLVLFALGNGTLGALAPAAAAAGFAPVFMGSLTAHVSSLDFLVLWMFFSPVLLEDGRRRGVFLGQFSDWSPSDKARFAFCGLVPVFGGLAWLLSRPPLK
ncbi:unnamed protein product [Effrenium voratum]|nr:unnamed protein product [Effrenium voratum]